MNSSTEIIALLFLSVLADAANVDLANNTIILLILLFVLLGNNANSGSSSCCNCSSIM